MKTMLRLGAARRFALCLILSLVFCSAGVAMATPLGTDFTYQGRLDLSGSPVNGTADFQFKLFGALSGGTQIGSTVAVNYVTVTDGGFTVTLDFGATAFEADEERWLELVVRSPAGSGYFVTLSPRQEITASPFTLKAQGVDGHSLDASDGSPSEALSVDAAGNVGIGTTTPTARLDVRGGAILVENLGDQADLLWLASERSWVFRQEGTEAGTALKLESIGGGGNKHFIVQTTGFMGVGTASPTAKLDVRGDIRLGSAGQFSATAGEENLRMLRGNIDGNGTIDAGTGFNCTRTSEGQYTIDFSIPFAGVPSFTATPHSLSIEPRVAEIRSLTASSAHIVISFVGNPETDSDWSFCVIGPR